MATTVVEVTPGGHELAAMLADLRAAPARGRAGARRLLGLSGSPGSGKSTLAALLTHAADAALVPMDGFHLADVELDRRGLRHRKGAPETFDAWGYAALVARLADDGADHTVMAPSFERDLEQPLAGAIAVEPGARLVVTEGNYLLLDDEPWRTASSKLDAVWHLRVPDDQRREWLRGRHVAHGKTEAQARAWVEEVDDPNAALVERAAARADAVLDLSRWDWRLRDAP